MKALFSGSRPTGSLTLGNYIGAISQWKRFQHEYDSVFCIVDLHAMSSPADAVRLRAKSLEFLALYVACGLDPERSTLLVQSQNSHHTELAWILNCCTAFGDLTRMTQFKEKSRGEKYVSAGLLNYPILMAADILLYQTELVPIGDDQVQHLELACSIARRFNSEYGPIFTIPRKMTPRQGGRIRNLLDPSRKMDKSHANARTYISLLDGPDEVRFKVMKAKTDTRGDFNIEDADEGITNLVTIMSVLTGRSTDGIVSEYSRGGYAEFKRALADVIIESMEPIQKEYRRIRTDEGMLQALLQTGKQRAIARSSRTIAQVKDTCGLFP